MDRQEKIQFCYDRFHLMEAGFATRDLYLRELYRADDELLDEEVEHFQKLEKGGR